MKGEGCILVGRRFFMLLTIQGYFDSGRFIADTPIPIPERKKTIVTILDETIDEINEELRQTRLWNEIFDQIENCEEILLGEPKRLHLRTVEEVDSI